MGNGDQFTKRPRYPNRYPGRLTETQSPVQSQQGPMPPPYDPSKGQADIGSSQSWSPPVPRASIVRASFDSRPPMAYDVFWIDRFDDGININPFFQVPAGNILILRQIIVALYPDSSAPTANQLNPWGDNIFAGTPDTSPVVPKLQLLVNEAPTNFWTQYGFTGLRGVPIYNALLTDICIPCFVLVDAGNTVRINIPNFIDIVNGLTAFNTYAHYYGNMLLSTGRPVISEVGNSMPLPVKADDREYI